jgi:hypothetical protein
MGVEVNRKVIARSEDASLSSIGRAGAMFKVLSWPFGGQEKSETSIFLWCRDFDAAKVWVSPSSLFRQATKDEIVENLHSAADVIQTFPF